MRRAIRGSNGPGWSITGRRNSTSTSPSGRATIVGSVALVCGEETLSYRQLEERSNALALYLTAQGAGPETIIAVCLERSAALVIGLLGVLKAGAGYLPLDPSYPRERLDYILSDAQPLLLLTQQSLSAA